MLVDEPCAALGCLLEQHHANQSRHQQQRAVRARARKPGEPRGDRESMIRVDQAGEYGATRIYAGQLAVLRSNAPETKLIARMAMQEERHLKQFNRLMAERRVRPTVLQPLWNVAGFALGAATALMSEKAALACTDAVETEIAAPVAP